MICESCGGKVEFYTHPVMRYLYKKCKRCGDSEIACPVCKVIFVGYACPECGFHTNGGYIKPKDPHEKITKYIRIELSGLNNA